MPMKKCIVCGGALPPRASKYCSKICHRKRNAEYAVTKRIEAGDPTVGVGKGGSNKRGKEHGQYVSGMGNFYKLRKMMRDTIKHCNRCGKDLTDAVQYEWCVHHIDHDRTHNVIENLEMLCKRCHQMEHDCTSNLPN